jgi:hypothetical protein
MKEQYRGPGLQGATGPYLAVGPLGVRRLRRLLHIRKRTGPPNSPEGPRVSAYNATG